MMWKVETVEVDTIGEVKFHLYPLTRFQLGLRIRQTK